jgi:nitrite reductase/ring-hydroxylating ferredoxin subunit
MDAMKAAELWFAGASSDVLEGGRLIVDVAGTSVGIFRLDGSLHAYENVCVHQGGPVCQGLLIPRVVEILDDSLVARGMKFDDTDLHIVCPWHGFEYSVRTGSHPGSPGLRLRRIPVSEEEGRIYVAV